jgi:hypothetical protein
MLDGLALKRHRDPRDPGADAFAFFSLIAATGFAVGWMAHALGF